MAPRIETMARDHLGWSEFRIKTEKLKARMLNCKYSLMDEQQLNSDINKLVQDHNKLDDLEDLLIETLVEEAPF